MQGRARGLDVDSADRDVRKHDGNLVITADLPGTKKGDVNVELHHDHVVIQGERRQDQTVNERGFYRS